MTSSPNAAEAARRPVAASAGLTSTSTPAFAGPTPSSTLSRSRRSRHGARRATSMPIRSSSVARACTIVVTSDSSPRAVTQAVTMPMPAADSRTVLSSEVLPTPRGPMSTRTRPWNRP